METRLLKSSDEVGLEWIATAQGSKEFWYQVHWSGKQCKLSIRHCH